MCPYKQITRSTKVVENSAKRILTGQPTTQAVQIELVATILMIPKFLRKQSDVSRLDPTSVSKRVEVLMEQKRREKEKLVLNKNSSTSTATRGDRTTHGHDNHFVTEFPHTCRNPDREG